MLRSLLSAAALVSTLGLAAEARGLPSEGELAPAVSVTDPDGQVLALAALRGRPILVMYEDRDSVALNDALKRELAVIAKPGGPAASLTIAAVADVSSFDFFPAKGIVKDAIRSQAKKQKISIYCDWSGDFRNRLKLERGTSNVVMIGKEGRVLFAAAGALGVPARQRLVGLIRRETAPP